MSGISRASAGSTSRSRVAPESESAPRPVTPVEVTSLEAMPAQQEKAVLVAVEFTGERRKLSPAASLARRSAQISAESNVSAESNASPESNEFRPEPVAGIPAGSSAVDFDAALAEFQELARSAGAEVAATVLQRRARPDAATLIGTGKIEEIAAVVASTGAGIVLFDHDLTPSQMRNLEKELQCRVIDRTQLILDIFARHARTREGQLQVELAQLEYQLPRLAGKGKAMSQLGGGIGTRGPGETRLETDRRKINLRIDHVKAQLESVRRIRRQQRQRREAVPVPVIALVGYTNAGKSTLFNQLTAAGVLESARMFATLDPKLKQMQLPSRRKVLLSDTVGFIRDLPHTLITSFRATLEEVERAEVLLHVQDASSPLIDEHKAEVEKVLGELEVLSKPTISVLNKIDLLGQVAQNDLPRGSRTVAVSGKTGAGISDLLASIDAALLHDPLIDRDFRIPQSEGRVIAALEAGAVVSGIRFEGNLAFLHAVGPASLLERFRRFRAHQPIP